MVQRKEQIRLEVDIRESTLTGGNPEGGAANGWMILDITRHTVWSLAEALLFIFTFSSLTHCHPM